MNKRLVALAVIAISCATVARVVSGSERLDLSLDVTASEDSVFARLSWTPAAGGAPIQDYVYSLFENGAVVAGGTTTGNTVVIGRAKPAPGDSIVLRGAVYAVDVYNQAGDTAYSANFVVHTALPAPPAAPIITLDTVEVASYEGPDSLEMFFPLAVFRGDTVVLTIGDTIQGCVVAWRDGQMYRPSDQAPVCLGSTFPAMLYRPLSRHIRVVEAE